jgi:ABC-type nitrate/sulfonate/bicarbonate transport system ATPase subunit
MEQFHRLDGRKQNYSVISGCIDAVYQQFIAMTPDNKDPRLVVRGIRKNFDELPVIEDISLEVDQGEFVSVLGVSGSGKTTLFNIISGLEKPDGGSVEVNGKIGYMMQKDLLLPWKRIIDNVSLPLTICGTKKAEARGIAGKYFELFGLAGHENDFPAELSGGMRQRAALLRTYLISGNIMLLDEPFASVDAITRVKLHEWLMHTYRQLNLSILLITHDIDEAILLSDRIYVISDKPAMVRDVMKVDFPRDRDNRIMAAPEYASIKSKILESLTGSMF